MASNENYTASLKIKFGKAIVCICNSEHFKFMLTFTYIRNKCTEIYHLYCEQIIEKYSQEE